MKDRFHVKCPNEKCRYRSYRTGNAEDRESIWGWCPKCKRPLERRLSRQEIRFNKAKEEFDKEYGNI